VGGTGRIQGGTARHGLVKGRRQADDRHSEARGADRANFAPASTTPRPECTGKAGIPDRIRCSAERSVHSGLRVLVHFGSAASGQAGVLIDRAAAYDRDGDAMRPVGGRRDEGKSEQVVATDRFKGDPQMAQRRKPSGRAAHHVRHRAHHGSYSRYRPQYRQSGCSWPGTGDLQDGRFPLR